jgi:hypothetical protein
MNCSSTPESQRLPMQLQQYVTGLQNLHSCHARSPALPNPPHILREPPAADLLPTPPRRWTMLIRVVEWVLQ